MRYIIIFILLFATFILKAQSILNLSIAVKSDGLTYGAWFDNLKNEYNVQVFVDDSALISNRFVLNSNDITISKALKTILPASYNFCEINNQLIISKNIKFIQTLPAYPLNSIHSIEVRQQNTSDYIDSKNLKVLAKIKLGKVGQANGASVVGTLKVVDSETKKPIYGAAILIKPSFSGLFTDQNGIAKVSLPTGTYILSVQYVGYESGEFSLVVLGDGEAIVELHTQSVNLRETEIFGDRQRDLMRKDPGIEKISIKEVRSIPTMGGETDFVKITTLLPGINSIGEGAAGINVRGGSYDQNAFYFNGLPVYNSAHIFGFFPAFNPNIINNVTVYKGYMPPEFGGKLSGVFDLESRKGNKEKFSQRGGISPIAANILVEGPIVKNKLSFVVSARSSFSDWVLRNIEDTVINQSSAAFNDFNAVLDFNDGKNRFSMTGYLSNDNFEMFKTSQYDYQNSGLSLKASRKLGKNSFLSISAYSASYQFSNAVIKNLSDSYRFNYEINHHGLKVKMDQEISDKHIFNYGIDAEFIHLLRGKIEPYNDLSFRKELNFGEENGFETALFFSDKIDLNKILSFDIGGRISYFATLGPRNVYQYAQGLPKNEKYIVDSLFYGKNETIASDFFPEYRVSATINTDNNGSLKFSANRAHQNLFLLNTSPALSPESQWKLSDNYLKPSLGSLFSFGVFRRISSLAVDYSAEVFYKKIDNFPEFIDGADFLGTSLVETNTLQGELETYGFEIFVRKSYSRLNGWLSYTYSRSLVKIEGQYAWEKINRGTQYPSNFDIPHAFNAMLNFQLRKRMQLSSVITWQSGRPTTLPVGSYSINNTSYIDYSDRNQYRIPNYFRMDLSLTIEGNLRKDKFAHSSLIISVYNLTGRDNPYSIFFDSIKGYINGYQYSVIAVPVFSISWLFKIGNYAS